MNEPFESFGRMRDLGERALSGEAPASGLDAALDAARAGDTSLARELAVALNERERRRVERAIRIRQETDAENREIGQRFTRAREMNGLSQSDAAERLGYKNSAPLSKIEAGFAPAPVWLFRRAATVYGVSTDYLHAASCYPERDPRTVEQVAIMVAMREALQKSAERIAERAIVAAAEAVPANAHLAEYADAVSETMAALEKVRELNRSFDDRTRGGARLVRSIENLVRITATTARYINRKRAVHQESADLMAAANGTLFDTIFEDGRDV